MDDALVERVAQALHHAMRPRLPWKRATGLTQRLRRSNARAALAVAEPAIRAAERDRIEAQTKTIRDALEQMRELSGKDTP